MDGAPCKRLTGRLTADPLAKDDACQLNAMYPCPT